MIRIHCRTNLDLSNEEWPTALPALPCIGDYIQSGVSHNGFQLQLKVVSVTWRKGSGLNGTWYPEIELHDGRSRSIKEFYEWYAPLVGRKVEAFI